VTEEEYSSLKTGDVIINTPWKVGKTTVLKFDEKGLTFYTEGSLVGSSWDYKEDILRFWELPEDVKTNTCKYNILGEEE
jgi:hypothetical protein